MRSEWANPDAVRLILTALMPENRLALEVSMSTGLRINDVLSLRTEQLRRAYDGNGRVTVREQKTGKNRRVYLRKDLRLRMLQQAGEIYVWPGRCAETKHRSRTTVYKDLRRAASLYRIDGKKLDAHLSPHSMRKVYAVNEYKRTGDLAAVQRDLRHTDPAVTALYALADVLDERQRKGVKKWKK